MSSSECVERAQRLRLTLMGRIQDEADAAGLVNLARQLPHLQRRHGLAVALEWLYERADAPGSGTNGASRLWEHLSALALDWLETASHSLDDLSGYRDVVRNMPTADYMVVACTWLSVFETVADVLTLMQPAPARRPVEVPQ